LTGRLYKADSRAYDGQPENEAARFAADEKSHAKLLAMASGQSRLMTGRNVFYSGARQVLVGMAAAALTFGVGRLIGVSLG
jgi:hypothetical protein